MDKENVILVKSYQFGLRIVKLHLHLSKGLKHLLEQILKKLRVVHPARIL